MVPDVSPPPTHYLTLRYLKPSSVPAKVTPHFWDFATTPPPWIYAQSNMLAYRIDIVPSAAFSNNIAVWKETLGMYERLLWCTMMLPSVTIIHSGALQRSNIEQNCIVLEVPITCQILPSTSPTHIGIPSQCRQNICWHPVFVFVNIYLRRRTIGRVPLQGNVKSESQLVDIY